MSLKNKDVTRYSAQLKVDSNSFPGFMKAQREWLEENTGVRGIDWYIGFGVRKKEPFYTVTAVFYDPRKRKHYELWSDLMGQGPCELVDYPSARAEMHADHDAETNSGVSNV